MADQKEEKQKYDWQNPRSIYDIVADLSKEVPVSMLKTRKQGGKDITFISWSDVTRLLDTYAPGWCYEVKNIQSIGGKVILTVRLMINCAEGLVYREATGQEDEDKSGYGDSTSNAESMALRRAAAKFGAGRYLYRGDVNTQPQGQQTQNRPAASNTGNRPPANNTSQPNTGGRISEKQLKYLLDLCTKNQVSEKEIAYDVSDGRTDNADELTAAEAKQAIDKFLNP